MRNDRRRRARLRRGAGRARYRAEDGPRRHPVVVIDSEPAIRDEPAGAVYHSPVVERLQRLELLDDLREIGVLQQAYHYWDIHAQSAQALQLPGVLRPKDTPCPFNLHLWEVALDCGQWC